MPEEKKIPKYYKQLNTSKEQKDIPLILIHY